MSSHASSTVKRPSWFKVAKKHGSVLPRGRLERLYMKDVKSRNLVVSEPPQYKPAEPRALRILQWNINGFDWCAEHSLEPDEINKLVLRFQADIIVLQEIVWSSKTWCAKAMVESLHAAGYRTAVAGENLVASLLPFVGDPEVVTFYDLRTAVYCQVRLCDEVVNIYGTHFHYSDRGAQIDPGVRMKELHSLLEHHRLRASGHPTVIVADFNQQRCRDYSPDEWTLIVQGMRERGQPQDDLVCDCLEHEGFGCSLDVAEAHRNWPPDSYPAPTHWTGTTIDYSFAKGLNLHGMYVVMTVLSDHLPVLADWILPGEEPEPPLAEILIPPKQSCPVCEDSGLLLSESCPLCAELEEVGISISVGQAKEESENSCSSSDAQESSLTACGVKAFQRRKEDFKCSNCGHLEKGNGYTNHCSQCLWSKHVDVNPGDRAADCGGPMEPVVVDTKSGEYIILQCCTICGHERWNKRQDQDNFTTILQIATEEQRHRSNRNGRVRGSERVKGKCKKHYFRR